MHRSLEGQAGNCFRFVSCVRARLVPICEVRSKGENPLSLFPFWTGRCSLFPLPIQLRLALSVMGCCSVVSASAAIIRDTCVCSLQGSEACVCAVKTVEVNTSKYHYYAWEASPGYTIETKCFGWNKLGNARKAWKAAKKEVGW